jgi:hypothetical protein
MIERNLDKGLGCQCELLAIHRSGLVVLKIRYNREIYLIFLKFDTSAFPAISDPSGHTF